MKKRMTFIVLFGLLISSQAVGIEFVSRLHPTDSGPWTAVFSIDTESGLVTEIFRSSSTVVFHGIANASDGRIYIGVQDYTGGAGTPEHTATMQIIPFAAFRSESGEIEYTMEDPIFVHSFPIAERETEPINNISALAVRHIGDGNYRVYFSTSSGATADGQIYYVDSTGTAQPYYTVRLSDMLTPSCEGLGGYWSGAFVFDESNNLFLSSGNHSPSTLYRVSGAGFDTVTGDPVWVHMRESGSMVGMDIESPSSLYFVDSGDDNIYRLDLETFAEVAIFHDASIENLLSIALLRLPATISRPVLPKMRNHHRRPLFPDLHLVSATPGKVTLKDNGRVADLPLRIIIENNGLGTKSTPFKIGTIVSVSKTGKPFSAPFTIIGSKDGHYLWVDKIGSGKSLAIIGKIAIKSPDGGSLKGRNVTITVQVDSCRRDASMPQHCRVRENDEKNNTAQVKIRL